TAIISLRASWKAICLSMPNTWVCKRAVLVKDWFDDVSNCAEHMPKKHFKYVRAWFSIASCK
ncbi:MAG TPA: hypothetical protein PK856_11510, partial [Vitreoscilla sp.]|nr:hypothetical protein [Vitreoscilla sp.]